jgi:hypothetical protein
MTADSEYRTEMAALASTVEEVRAANFPEIDGKLVADILEVQRRFSEDRVEAQRRTEQLINQWVAAAISERD